MCRKSLYLISFVLVVGLVDNAGGQIDLKASNPDPADGAESVATPLVKWTAGRTAAFHEVYFGTNPTPGPAEFRGRQPFTMYFHAPGLAPNTTYYWRIDEVEGDGVTIHTGDVWSFTSAPLTAYNPYPPDGRQCIDIDANLRWGAGIGAITHDVYFGTNRTDVAAGTGGTFIGNQAATTYNFGTLANGTTYYWRIDEVEIGGTTKHTGEVWRFTTMPVITITDPDLVGWWKLDKGEGTVALDWSGHGNDGHLRGDTQWLFPGWVGQAALHFDGINDYVAIQNLHYDSSTDLPELTVCAWVRTNSGSGQYIVSFDRNDFWRFQISGADAGTGQVGLGVYTSSDQAGVGSVRRVDDGQWHHAAGVFDNGLLTMYIDGTPDASATGGTTFGRRRNTRYGFMGANSEATSFDGARGDGSPVEGELDDVRIYHRALTQAELKEVMRGEIDFAWNPNPANMSITDIEHTTFLSWSPGDKVGKHDVYFGTDQIAVESADTSDTTGIYQGRQDANSYFPPEGLEYDQDYYWRIDEFNTDGTITTGKIWSFNVANYLTVDDMESYTNDVGNRIFQTWIDGFGYSEPPPGNPGNGTGSAVGHDIWDPASPNYQGNIAETTITQSGVQSMPLGYNNSAAPFYSETERQWPVPQDWTRKGVKALGLWFYGDPCNVSEPMYVAVEDSTGRTAVVPYAGDVDDVRRPIWREWNIDLREFSNAGVNLRAVKKMLIGIGDRAAPQVGGSGDLLIDDIRLYWPRCVPSLLKPVADVNDDCVVDYFDLEMMAADWLKTDYVVSTLVPDAAGLVAHYKFDGDASDSSGSGNDGVLRGPAFVSGKFDQAIGFDGVDDYVAIQNLHYESTGHPEISVSAWIRTGSSDDQIIATFDRNEYWRLQIGGEAGGDGLLGFEVMTSDGQVDTDEADNWPGNTGRVDDGEWHHVAGVFDNGTLTMYIDGNPKEPYFGGSTFGTGTTRYGYLGVGSESTAFDLEPRTPASFFAGEMDEVRIYHRALSEAEVAYLADESPGDGQLYVAVPSVADIHSEESPLARSVNLKDYVLLAQQWLDEQLWPQP